MKSKSDRRCNDCVFKKKGCDVWVDKKETTASSWDKNRFAISCGDYKEEKVNGI